MKDVFKIGGPSVVTGLLVVFQLYTFDEGWYDILLLTLSGICFGGCVGLAIATWDSVKLRRHMQEKFDAIDREVEEIQRGKTQ